MENSPYSTWLNSVFKSDLAFKFSARIRLFRKDIDSLEIGGKAYMLALFVYSREGLGVIHTLMLCPADVYS